MTKSELAKLANVSLSTVSKAFGDAEDISEETKSRIFEIARETGCFGKFYKGKYPKKIIAVICPELKSNYYTAFVEQMQKLIENAGCVPVISTDNFSLTKQKQLIEYYASFLKADGIIVFGLKSVVKKGFETPIVSIFSSCDAAVDSVNTDTFSAVKSAVKLLMDYGHRNIAFIGEKLTEFKTQAFEKIMKERKDVNFAVAVSEYRFEKAGEDGIEKLLEENRDFSALICAYDNIAMGAINALNERGIQTPEDVSVVGIDNISACDYFKPSLTSIGSSPEEICMIAWDLLQKKMDNPYYKSRQNIVIKSKLTERESVTPYKKRADT